MKEHNHSSQQTDGHSAQHRTFALASLCEDERYRGFKESPATLCRVCAILLLVSFAKLLACKFYLSWQASGGARACDAVGGACVPLGQGHQHYQRELHPTSGATHMLTSSRITDTLLRAQMCFISASRSRTATSNTNSTCLTPGAASVEATPGSSVSAPQLLGLTWQLVSSGRECPSSSSCCKRPAMGRFSCQLRQPDA